MGNRYVHFRVNGLRHDSAIGTCNSTALGPIPDILILRSGQKCSNTTRSIKHCSNLVLTGFQHVFHEKRTNFKDDGPHIFSIYLIQAIR